MYMARGGAPTPENPTPPIFHWLAWVRVGVTQMLGFALGEMQILAFIDTNMLVFPTRNFE